ncbi:Metalloprotease stcE precursor [Yersinia nurmii]|uniref:Metalloprotease stcE n=2 Tax=Yersinia nurmii TaxID=685706 RepID=A0ABM9SKV0_9GAMM|nr:Metalloprotease stcE precursor [Yersinia nurmii]
MYICKWEKADIYQKRLFCENNRQLDKVLKMEKTTTNKKYVITFNNNDFPSDLDGELSASILFVQNSVIPAGKHISDDIQPHLASHRKTMVLFKSKQEIDEATPVILTLKDAENQVVGTYTMRPPKELTQLVEQIKDFNGSEDDFIEPVVYDKSISGQTELNKLKDDTQGNQIKSILSTHNSLKISTRDGGWIKDFYMPAADELDGKLVTLSSNAGYNSFIHYSGKKITLYRGLTVVLRNYKGSWYSLDDVKYSQISFGEGFWSIIIPFEKVVPGIQLDFEHNGKHGQLGHIQVGAPNELIIHTIDLGMLTPYRNAFEFQKKNEYHRQYFQQVPLSRLIVSQYEPQYFKEVMLPEGVLLTDYDPSTGGVYEGTMRQRIGKELISIGIDNANYGINSSQGKGEKGHPYSTAQLTAHNSIGKYVNGIIVHGLSGGGGIVTLQSSIGNEFSHEVGHNYGLGHYPNGYAGSVHQAPDKPNSCWGWDSDNDQFIPNFEKSISNKPTCQDEQCAEPFAGHSLGRDAMASGSAMYMQSNAFTLHTPYSLSKIQTFLENKAVFDRHSPTGFNKWNATTQTMEPWENRVETKSNKDAAPSDVTLASMTALLERHDLITVSFKNKNFAKDIYIPNATEENKGKAVRVQNLTNSHSLLHVNNQLYTIAYNHNSVYLSNGKTWLEVAEYSLSEAKRPYKQGVAVTTLVGYYDPQGALSSYIFPALHGSFGMVYQGDGDRANICYLEVQFEGGAVQQFKLSANRIDATCMNKFHINVEEGLNPIKASVFVGGAEVSSIDIAKPTSNLEFSVNGVALS